jgi:hypothetical protein
MRSRALYDWDFSREREFIENLFCTRFNFFLIAYSLFVTAAATAMSTRELFIGVTVAGAGVCIMTWLAIMRAYAKLRVIFDIIYKVFTDHPSAIIDQEVRSSPRRLFRVNHIVAYWLPAFAIGSLLLAAAAKYQAWI